MLSQLNLVSIFLLLAVILTANDFSNAAASSSSPSNHTHIIRDTIPDNELDLDKPNFDELLKANTKTIIRTKPAEVLTAFHSKNSKSDLSAKAESSSSTTSSKVVVVTDGTPVKKGNHPAADFSDELMDKSEFKNIEMKFDHLDNHKFVEDEYNDDDEDDDDGEDDDYDQYDSSEYDEEEDDDDGDNDSNGDSNNDEDFDGKTDDNNVKPASVHVPSTSKTSTSRIKSTPKSSQEAKPIKNDIEVFTHSRITKNEKIKNRINNDLSDFDGMNNKIHRKANGPTKTTPKSKSNHLNDDDDIDYDNDGDNIRDDDDDDNIDDDIGNEENEDDHQDNFRMQNGFKTEEEVVYSQNVPCPRYCICNRNRNNYLVAYCSRIDTGTQKFGLDVTDLVVTDVSPKYPILLGPNFFVDLGLKHVLTINIVNCSIEFLHADAFAGLDELYAVNLTNVGLAVLSPDTFATNKQLRLLTISGNDLNVMSNMHYLIKSSSIEELDLSRNNLMELHPNAFALLNRIIYINLSQNNLQQIPVNVFANLSTLEEIDLSYNSLKNLPENLFDGTSLGILHLRYNSITNETKFCTKNLQQLDLSFNQIRQINYSMFDKMTGLTHLNLKGNGLTKIQPVSFASLKHLRHIDLSINELDQISNMIFYKNSDLDVIRLNDNPRLSQLPTDGFRNYNGNFNVYYLDISNCAIGALGHQTFSTMPHLFTLKLAWNNINNLDATTFASLYRLVNLDLSNNLISKLGDATFLRNTDLTKLNLSGNPIRRLSVRLFQSLKKLTDLDVSDCELKTLLSDAHDITENYKFFQTLRSLNASSNQIHKISSADVRHFKNLRSLDITHNPIKCNEGFQDFVTYVSLDTRILPYKMPSLDNIIADGSLEKLQVSTSWASIADEVCKREENLLYPNDNKKKTMFALLENWKANKTAKNHIKHKIIRHPIDISDDSSLDSSERDSLDVEEIKKKFDHAKKSNKNVKIKFDSYDEEEENKSDIGGEEDDYDVDYQDWDKTVSIVKKIKDLGIRVKDIKLSEETTDEFLSDKLLAENYGKDRHHVHHETDKNYEKEPRQQIFIETSCIYDKGCRFILYMTAMVVIVFILLLISIKITAMVLNKRGERYRMSLMQTHKNSIVYQKLSEEIKPPKELKQPKVHRYAPISQV